MLKHARDCCSVCAAQCQTAPAGSLATYRTSDQWPPALVGRSSWDSVGRPLAVTYIVLARAVRL
jgi:hypothetical protein